MLATNPGVVFRVPIGKRVLPSDVLVSTNGLPYLITAKQNTDESKIRSLD
jgi:hypothetical protein